VLAHHRMCNLANWSRPNNITSYSRAPGRATEEQARHLTYTCGECQAPHRCLGKKTLDICPMLQVTIDRICPSQESDSFCLHILRQGLVAVQGIRIIINLHSMHIGIVGKSGLVVRDRLLHS
jgi:hypothetical protein